MTTTEQQPVEQVEQVETKAAPAPKFTDEQIAEATELFESNGGIEGRAKSETIRNLAAAGMKPGPISDLMTLICGSKISYQRVNNTLKNEKERQRKIESGELTPRTAKSVSITEVSDASAELPEADATAGMEQVTEDATIFDPETASK